MATKKISLAQGYNSTQAPASDKFLCAFNGLILFCFTFWLGVEYQIRDQGIV